MVLLQKSFVPRLIVATLIVATWCGIQSFARDAKPNPSRENISDPARIDSEHLPNPVQLSPKVISGGLPDGDAAFKELADRGIKTIISVDGATPDVDAAAKYGLRYVHLPHGYDGIPSSRVTELAKAVRDLEGPIYIHCHHGKHRSPAAAAVACVAAGLLPEGKAEAVLKLAGTDPHYRGLYRSACQVKPLDAGVLDRLDVQFQPVVQVPPMAEAMVELGHTHDHLKQIAAADWQTPENHPDLDPAHEALMLQEHFTELLRTDDVARQPDDFRRWLMESETAAKSMVQTLRQMETDSADPTIPDSLVRAASQIGSNCKACHAKYRDAPRADRR
ncbi:dual specificity protein phosphatase family protein [Roseiconus nitratireducens]|uniref:dual specificity protein phosphatase family protein n=1 Tax=Roseiconus nitratireducens TaxID=2605748 RepID=UPI001375456C|nr:dual specificity protein phosphatase family protein [Roseiconus nitratireducens]